MDSNDQYPQTGEPYWMYMAKRNGWLTPEEQKMQNSHRKLVRFLAILTAVVLLLLLKVNSGA